MHSQIPYPQPALQGAGFRLRPFRVDDFAGALALEQDRAASRWVQPLPAEDGEAVVRFYDACRREGSLLHFVIADRADDGYLGEAMLALAEHHVGEAGCCVVPAARGRGIASETLRLLTDWAFATLDLGRVQVLVARENIAALRLAASAGFEREGVLRSYWELDGGRLDAVILARVQGPAGVAS